MSHLNLYLPQTEAFRLFRLWRSRKRSNPTILVFGQSSIKLKTRIFFLNYQFQNPLDIPGVKKPPEIITHESFDKTKIELIAENEKLPRMMLSWRVFDHLSAEGTRQILIEAAQHLSSSILDIILVDGGSENRVEKFGNALSWAREKMRRISPECLCA